MTNGEDKKIWVLAQNDGCGNAGSYLHPVAAFETYEEAEAQQMLMAKISGAPGMHILDIPLFALKRRAV